MKRNPRSGAQQADVKRAPSDGAPAPATRPLIFISHDHRDAELAELFETLITDSSGGYLRSFRSSDKKGVSGIEYGAEWYTAVMSRLDEATDVVALITPNSINRPWILYEAGVAKGKLGKQVLGVALGVPLAAASQGPFAQFQNCGDDEESLTGLILQLIKRNSEAEPREAAARRDVVAFREAVARAVSTQSQRTGADEQVSSTTVAKLLEEIKAMFREQTIAKSPHVITGNTDYDHVRVELRTMMNSTDKKEVIAALQTSAGMLKESDTTLARLLRAIAHRLEGGNVHEVLTAIDHTIAQVPESRDLPLSVRMLLHGALTHLWQSCAAEEYESPSAHDDPGSAKEKHIAPQQ